MDTLVYLDFIFYWDKLCLLNSITFVILGVDDLIRDFQFGISMKEKLRRVIEWVQQAGSSLHDMHLHGYQVFSSLSVLLLLNIMYL